MILSLFWAPNILIGGAISLAMFFMVIIADNIFPRLDWRNMLKTTWGIGFSLIILNVIILAIGGMI
jgi:hypothetical protein